MSAPDRRAMVERPGVDLSVRRQCALLNLARSGVYRPKPVIGAGDLALMRRIDELHLELPFYGSRRMTFELSKEGRGVNRKRVQRLMRVMGIEALVPRPGTSKPAPGHKIYPYLLRGLAIAEPNHVWAADTLMRVSSSATRDYVCASAIMEADYYPSLRNRNTNGGRKGRVDTDRSRFVWSPKPPHRERDLVYEQARIGGGSRRQIPF
jgi:transposase InsO family protein